MPALAVVPLLPCLNALYAQTYPHRPIRLVVPFSAGGAADVPARILSQKLSEMLGQPIVVDNRPGAGATIGADLVAKARPDGHTLLSITAAHFVSAALYANPPYHPLDDFAPVTAFATSAYGLAVHPSLEAKSVKELIALARASPRKIDYASSGNGSLQHLFGALFLSMTGTDMTHIPYKGSAPAITDVMGGRVKVTFASIINVLPHTRSGRLIALGVSSAKRSALLAEVPTIAEAGVPGYEATQWTGLAGPRGLPPAIAVRLHADILKLSQRADYADALVPSGAEVFYQYSPEQAAIFMRLEMVKWAKLVRDSGARIQ